MSCNSCKYFHKVSGMTYTANTSLVLTTTNSTNISSLDDYCFVFPCSQNPSSVVSGSPVQVYITVNGGNYQLFNKYHLPVYSNHLQRKKLYKAWFVTSNDGTTSWIELKEYPKCKCNA